MMGSVCLNCQERHLACHSSCPKYLAAKAKHDEAKRAWAESQDLAKAICDIQYYGLEKYKRDRRRRR